MSFQERRKYTRRTFTEPTRFFIPISRKKRSVKIRGEGVSVDIGEGGLGMITPLSLDKGEILFFEHDIKIKEDIIACGATVRWAEEIENNSYRVGLKFFAYIDKNRSVWKLVRSLFQRPA